MNAESLTFAENEPFQPMAAEPEAIAAEPEAIAAEPEAIAAEPEAIAAEPEVVAPAPPPAAPALRVTAPRVAAPRVTAPVTHRPPLLQRAASGLLNLAVDGALLAAGAGAGAQIAMRIQVRRHPYPTPHQFAPILEHRARLAYRRPEDTLGLLAIAAGMTVLDLGCGVGLFAEEMARSVGAQGLVHAVDLQQAMLDRTAQRLAAAALADRCLLHRAGAYALPIESASIDLAVVVATLGEIPDRLHALLELHRVVKPGGKVAISEELPHPAYMTASGVRRVAEEAGFVFAAKSGSPICYTSVFNRP